jgi:hypothetical protein
MVGSVRGWFSPVARLFCSVRTWCIAAGCIAPFAGARRSQYVGCVDRYHRSGRRRRVGLRQVDKPLDEGPNAKLEVAGIRPFLPATSWGGPLPTTGGLGWTATLPGMAIDTR